MIVIEGRGQRQRAEPARARPGQPLAGDGAARAVAARRRHRARRRVRLGDRHRATADAGRARAVSRLRDQQVSRRPVAVRRGRPHARGAARRRAASASFPTPPTCSSTPRTAWRCRHGAADAGAARRADRDRPIPAALERDRLLAADLGGVDHVAAARTRSTSSSCPAARTPCPISHGCGAPVWRTGFSSSTAGARPSSASAAAIRCWAAPLPIRTEWNRQRGQADGLGLIPAVTELARDEDDARGHRDDAWRRAIRRL